MRTGIKAGVGAIAFVLLGAWPAGAVAVTNLSTSTTIFFDSFESGDLLHPGTGAWTLGPSAPGVSVTNAVSPGPAEGSFYAQSFRQTTTTLDEGNLQAEFSSAQTNPGDMILLRMMVYLPSATDTDARGQFMLDDGDFNSARAWVRPNGAGHVEAVGPGFAVSDTGISYLTDQWQEWDLSYAIGSGTFSVTVGDVTVSGLSSPTSGAVAFADLFNGVGNPAGSFFLDAVPQPSSGAPEPSGFFLGGAAMLALSPGLQRRVR